MIPKKIHYCWFGGKEKNRLAQKCINSWKKICPDYEVIEWNETNFDVYYNGYTKFCYENKKWAFLSDYVRLMVIYENGGIYLDTDVEVVRAFDDLLLNDAFFGFENNAYVNTGQGFGCVKEHNLIADMLKLYNMIEPNENGVYPLRACPELNTEVLVSYGLKLSGCKQNLNGVLVLPQEYLNPYDDPTGRLNKTDNTYSIHWYGKSWVDKRKVLRSRITQKFHRIFGVKCFDFIKRIK